MKRIISLALAFYFSIAQSFAIITDDFVEETLSKDLKIRKYTPTIIVDTFAESNTAKSIPIKKVKVVEILPTIKDKKVYKKYIASNDTTIGIKLIQPLSTKSKPEEGSEILFVTTKAVTLKDKFYPENSIVKARIETISPNAMWGTPAEIIISNFTLDGIPLEGEISKIGHNNTLWVKPISIIGAAFGGSGIMFMFIRGGHAKIKTDEVFNVCY